MGIHKEGLQRDGVDGVQVPGSRFAGRLSRHIATRNTIEIYTTRLKQMYLLFSPGTRIRHITVILIGAMYYNKAQH